MGCVIKYKGQSIPEEQFLQYLNKQIAINQLFETDSSFANQVYEALGLKGNNTVRLYRIENKNIPYDESREGIVSKKEIIGGFFTDSPNTVANYIRKNQSTEGINLVYVDVLKSDLDKYHVSKNEYAKNMDVESDNWIIPQNINRNYVDLKDLTKVTGNFMTLSKAKTELSDIINNLPKNEITPQQKQQALQQYSQYLDTIFPDSKVKDIVYHGVTKGREAYNNILQNGFLTTNKSNWSNNKDKQFKGVFFTDLSTATSYGVNLEREIRPEEKDFVIPAIVNVETLLTPKMGLVSGTVTKLRNENSDIKNLGIQGEEGSEGVHENTVVFEPEQIHVLGGKNDIQGFKDYMAFQNSEFAKYGTYEEFRQFITNKSFMEIENRLIETGKIDRVC